MFMNLQSSHRRTTKRALLALGVAVTTALGLAACGPDIGAGPAETDASMLQSPDSPKGEITIWDRSGDLFNVFDAAIAEFNKKYPDITVNHEAVDIDAKLQNTL